MGYKLMIHHQSVRNRLNQSMTMMDINWKKLRHWIIQRRRNQFMRMSGLQIFYYSLIYHSHISNLLILVSKGWVWARSRMSTSLGQLGLGKKTKKKIQGVTSYRFKSKNYLEMCLAPPWKPIECMVQLPEQPDHTIDKWGFATTISEISSWCQESDTRMGYPEESSNFRMVFRIKISCLSGNAF